MGSNHCIACGYPRLLRAAFCARCGADFRASDAELDRLASPHAPAGSGPLGVTSNGVVDDAPALDDPHRLVSVVQSSEVGRSADSGATRVDNRPSGPRNRRPVVLVGIGVLMLALLASVAFGYTTNQSLDRSKIDLASNRQTLSTTQSSLTDTTSQLSTQTAARSQAESEASGLNNQVSDLQNQLAARNTCVSALQADETQLEKIQREQTTQFNRGAKDSNFAKALDAYVAAVREVSTDYYNAFSQAWDANFSGANLWVGIGNSAVARASAQAKLYNAAIVTINAGTTKVDKEEAALAESITKTLSLCQGATGSPASGA